MGQDSSLLASTNTIHQTGKVTGPTPLLHPTSSLQMFRLHLAQVTNPSSANTVGASPGVMSRTPQR